LEVMLRQLTISRYTSEEPSRLSRIGTTSSVNFVHPFSSNTSNFLH
jgi:hypothetical protein